jgi:hypothetical protein
MGPLQTWPLSSLQLRASGNGRVARKALIPTSGYPVISAPYSRKRQQDVNLLKCTLVSNLDGDVGNMRGPSGRAQIVSLVLARLISSSSLPCSSLHLSAVCDSRWQYSGQSIDASPSATASTDVVCGVSEDCARAARTSFSSSDQAASPASLCLERGPSTNTGHGVAWRCGCIRIRSPSSSKRDFCVDS